MQSSQSTGRTAPNLSPEMAKSSQQQPHNCQPTSKPWNMDQSKPPKNEWKISHQLRTNNPSNSKKYPINDCGRGRIPKS